MSDLVEMEGEVGLKALSDKATPGFWSADDGDLIDADGFCPMSSSLNLAISRRWQDANPDKHWGAHDESHREMGDFEGKANAEFIAALVNAYRSGELVHRTSSLSLPEEGDGNGAASQGEARALALTGQAPSGLAGSAAAIPSAGPLAAVETARQKLKWPGYTDADDDRWTSGELADFARNYIGSYLRQIELSPRWLLEKAMAFGLSELERLDRRDALASGTEALQGQDAQRLGVRGPGGEAGSEAETPIPDLLPDPSTLKGEQS